MHARGYKYKWSKIEKKEKKEEGDRMSRKKEKKKKKKGGNHIRVDNEERAI